MNVLIEFVLKAIQRVIKRDNSTEELAKRRIDSQPSNESMVNEATVVFATQWNREFSKQQANCVTSRTIYSIEFENIFMFFSLLFCDIGGRSMERIARAFDET